MLIVWFSVAFVWVFVGDGVVFVCVFVVVLVFGSGFLWCVMFCWGFWVVFVKNVGFCVVNFGQGKPAFP